jgi:ABC-2 type transport system permease protein
MAEPASVAAPLERAPRAPRAGWRIVAAKELADHLTSIRVVILLALVGLAAALTVSAAAGGLNEAAPQESGSPALFLRLFITAPERFEPFTFLFMVGLLAPLLGITFGFDAINGERSQGTLPRLVAQPIHRDDVINGKFAAGLAVIGMILVALTLIVAGLGLLRLGIVPTGEEVARMVAWLVLTIVYVAFWLGFATLCSVALHRAATSALVTIAAWLVLTIFIGLLVGLLTDTLAPVPDQPTPDELLRNARFEVQLGRISPSTLYEEATRALLNPQVRTFATLLPISVVDRAAIGAPLSFEQSLLLAWPQTVALVALTVICFAAAYVLFMRQEIRA